MQAYLRIIPLQTRDDELYQAYPPEVYEAMQKERKMEASSGRFEQGKEGYMVKNLKGED